MQRVVRLSFAGLLVFAGAGITACGDKITIPPAVNPPVDSVVHSVTVSPASASVAVGSTIQLAASVDAGAGVTVRTVTWSSSDATIASVDPTGKVTGVKAGNATIIAKSSKDANVSGAAAVTVAGGGVPTVTISSVTSANVPVPLTNASGQLDINLNVEANGQVLKTVTATITCGAKSKSASQSISSPAQSDVAAAAVPITLSINTATFNVPTGVPDLNNGSCTLSALATTASGQQTATNNTALVLNNTDVMVLKSANSGSTVADVAGAYWKSGNITVTVIPVLYSGKTLSTAAISLPGASPATQLGVTFTSGVATATWSGSSGAAPSVKGLTLGTTLAQVTPAASFIDSQGNVVVLAQANPLTESQLRVDNQAPPAQTAVDVVYTPNTQNTAANWVGKAFTFTQAIALQASAQQDNNGVGKVTYTTQYSPAGAGTYTTFSDVNTLAETSTSTAYDLRAAVCDALNNCANTFGGLLTTFGVDLTAPTASTTAGAGPKANEIIAIGPVLPAALTGGGNLGVSASDPQGAGGVTGSGFGAAPVLASETRLAPNGTAGQASSCVIGTGASCKAAAQPLSFPISVVIPGQYALSYTVVDQAGNGSPAVTANYYIDQTSPAISGGISIPASITVGSSFASSGIDNMDFASAHGYLHYPTAPGTTGRVIIPATSTAAGVPFDATLSRASDLLTTMTAQQFFRSLGSINNAAIITAGVRPDFVGIRGVDAAGNLSTPNQAALPLANIAAGTTPVIGTDLANFTASVSAATVSNGSGSGAKTTTISAVVQATGPAAGTPFAQVCFYLESPSGVEGALAGGGTKVAAGDLVLLNCTSTTTTTLVGANKLITSTFAWDPDAGLSFAAAPGLAVNLYVLGITAAGDALITSVPVIVNLVN